MKPIAAGLLACLALAGCTTRPLTPPEIAFLGTVQGENVDYDAITIHKGGAPDLLPRGAAVTVGHDIYYEKARYRDDFTAPDGGVIYVDDRALLAHEVTHVWQYRSGATPDCTLEALVAEHREYGRAVYDYPEPLDPRRTFTSYRCEQQGRIVEDWVMKRASGDPQAPVYEAVIRAAMPQSTLDRLAADKVRPSRMAGEGAGDVNGEAGE